MAVSRHEFQITGLNPPDVRPIMDAANAIGNPGTINGSYDQATGTLFIGIVGENIAPWVAAFNQDIQRRIGRLPVNLPRDKLTDMTRRIRCETGPERRSKILTPKKLRIFLP